jgi:hypothetical protein
MISTANALRPRTNRERPASLVHPPVTSHTSDRGEQGAWNICGTTSTHPLYHSTCF